jgi:hypothetical protein
MSRFDVIKKQFEAFRQNRWVNIITPALVSLLFFWGLIFLGNAHDNKINNYNDNHKGKCIFVGESTGVVKGIFIKIQKEPYGDNYMLWYTANNEVNYATSSKPYTFC